MRELYDVIRQLLEVIPEDKDELIDELSKFIDSDNSYQDWNDVGDILYKYVFSDFYPDAQWQFDVDVIWVGDDDPYYLSNSNF